MQLPGEPSRHRCVSCPREAASDRHRISANGTHQITSLARLMQPKRHGSSPLQRRLQKAYRSEHPFPTSPPAQSASGAAEPRRRTHTRRRIRRRSSRHTARSGDSWAEACRAGGKRTTETARSNCPTECCRPRPATTSGTSSAAQPQVSSVPSGVSFSSYADRLLRAVNEPAKGRLRRANPHPRSLSL